MPHSSVSVLLISSLLAVSDATGSSIKCNPSTFSFPSLSGAGAASIQAKPVYNYTSNPHFVPEAISIAGGDGPSFCNVTLTYTRPGTDVVINVQAWLPLELSKWNGRFIGVGGGGFVTGELGGDHITTLLHHGYAAAVTDGGHDYRDMAHAPWALRSPGNVNWDLLIDYAYRSLHDLAVIGKSVTKQYFDRDPTYSYWRGCSTGGRQGLIIAQRYPEDWDGIMASAPAVNLPRMVVGAYWPQFVMNRVLREYPHSCELDAITQAAITACDSMDGTVDGVISLPEECSFDAKTMVGKTTSCDGQTRKITTAAVKVAEAIWAGAKSRDGEAIGFSYPVGTPLTGLIALANTICPPSSNGTTSCAGAPYPLVTEWMRMYVVKDPSFDPISLKYDEYERIMHHSVQEYDGILGSNDPDLSEFRRLGKKMITWHGINDELIPMHSTRTYYDSVLEFDPDAADYYRYFEVPGVNHCHSGPGTSFPIHSLETLRKWVEKGNAPEVLDTVKLDAQGSGKNETKGSDVCMYPRLPRGDGSCATKCKGNPHHQ